eukprot:jgi/Mesvir1/24709/Mv26004-RA.1
MADAADVKAISNLINTDPIFKYACASRFHIFFGHGTNAYKFARAFGGAPMLEACRECYENCPQCQSSGPKPPRHHVKHPPARKGEIVGDVLFWAHMPYFIAIDRYAHNVAVVPLRHMEAADLAEAIDVSSSFFSPLESIQMDRQFACLEGQPGFECLKTVGREDHTGQGIVERAVQEFKQAARRQGDASLSAYAARLMWALRICACLNRRVLLSIPSRNVVITAEGLQHGHYPPEIEEEWARHLQGRFANLVRRDTRRPVTAYSVGDLVWVHKEGPFGKRGQWNGPATVVSVDGSVRKAVVSLQDKQHHIPWSKLKHYQPNTSAWERLLHYYEDADNFLRPPPGDVIAPLLPMPASDPMQMSAEAREVEDDEHVEEDGDLVALAADVQSLAREPPADLREGSREGITPAVSQGPAAVSQPRRGGGLLSKIVLGLRRDNNMGLGSLRRPPQTAGVPPQLGPSTAVISSLLTSRALNCGLLIDTQAQVSIIGANCVDFPLLPSHWTQVTDFARSGSYKVLGEFPLTILGADTPMCVVEGYDGPALLGQPFLTLPGVTVSSTQLSRAGFGCMRLNNFSLDVAARGLSLPMVAAMKGVEYKDSELPPARDLLTPKALTPDSLGISFHDVATESPMSFHDVARHVSTEEGLDNTQGAMLAAGERWLGLGCVEPVDLVPRDGRLLRFKWTFQMKPVPGTDRKVEFARPVVLEFSGSSDLPSSALTAPGLNKDTWRLLVCFHLGRLNKGLPHGSAVLDFSKAFLNGDSDETAKLWEGTTPLYVRTPKMWEPIVGKKFMRLVKAVDGTVAGPRAWRKSLERLLLNRARMMYSDLDPSLFVGVWKGELVFVFVHADDCDCLGPREWIVWFHSLVHSVYPVGKLVFREPGKIVPFMGMDTILDHDEQGQWVMLLHPKGSYVPDLVKEVMARTGPILPSECGALRGKLNWLACTTSPDLAVLSRLTDDVLCLLARPVVAEYVQASPGLVLQGVDWDKPIELGAYCDSSLDARVLTKMRGRCAAVSYISNADQSAPSSIFAWFSRLHRRVYVGSDTAEARAYCEAASELAYFHALLCWILKLGGLTTRIDRVMRTDSQALVDFIENPYARTRDLDFLRVKEFSDALHTEHVAGDQNCSDALTKLYSSAKAQYTLLRHQMNNMSLGQPRH